MGVEPASFRLVTQYLNQLRNGMSFQNEIQILCHTHGDMKKKRLARGMIELK
jgi:hypothetical protein